MALKDVLQTLPIPFVAGLFVFACGVYSLIIYPAWVSHLSHIPNAHWSVPFSRFWILRERFKNRENRTLLATHRRVGPIVRIGPAELSIDGLDGVRTVYPGGFEKPGWYAVFDNYGVPCMFSTKNSREHSLRKRMISNVYSKSYLHASEPSKAQSKIILFDRLLPILKESAAPYQAPHGIDVHSLFLGTTMDFIAAYLWGIRNGTNFIQNKGYREHWLELYKARVENGFFIQELPQLTGICRMFGLRLYPKMVEWATKELENWNHELCKSTLESEVMADIGNIPPEDEPVVLKAVVSGIDKEEKVRGRDSLIYSTTIQKRDLAIESELFDHVLAGQETAGVALTYATWRLSQDQGLQRELQQELRSLHPSLKMNGADGDTLPNPKDLDALPLLHAVLMETLRLHAPLPGAQPRQTSSFCQIGSYTVPPGVRVAAMAYTLHRDWLAFPEPEKFVPGRWLNDDADKEASKERHKQFWAFSSGGRMCIGSNFAINEMKLVLAAIYTNFTTYVVDDSGMEQTDGYSGRPAGEQLHLRFEPIE